MKQSVKVREHIAYFADPRDYRVLIRNTYGYAPGICEVWGSRAHGVPADVVMYCFNAALFTIIEAKAWLEERGLYSIRLESAREICARKGED